MVPIVPKQSTGNIRKHEIRLSFFIFLNGGFGERDPQMVIVTHVVVV